MLRQLLAGSGDDFVNDLQGVAPISMESPWSESFGAPANAPTSDIFSSTFAVLDTGAPFQEQWPSMQKNHGISTGLYLDSTPATSQSFLQQPQFYEPLQDHSIPRYEMPVSFQEPAMSQTLALSMSASPQQHALFPGLSGLSGGLSNGLAGGLSSGLTGGLTGGLSSGGLSGSLTGGLSGSLTGSLAGSLAGGLTGNIYANSALMQQPQTSVYNNSLPPPIKLEMPLHSIQETPICQRVAKTLSPRRERKDFKPVNIRRPPTLSPLGHMESPTLSGSSTESDLISPEHEHEGEEERVMCIACRGVYPSRRSLTGHIGRNEKCREIIDSGRNYMDQVASGTAPPVGTENAVKAGAITNGQDGLSPICPFCDRFISHYKGNIRRHINQCGKNSNCQKRSRPEKEKKEGGKRRKREDGLMGDPQAAGISQSVSQILSSSTMIKDDGAGTSSNEPKRDEPPEDAYICNNCEFVTVYKGNMKRHLNTCHPPPDCPDLKAWDRKLEAMRASAMGLSQTEMLERLQIHKQNSTRGRKPRTKKEDGSQSSDNSADTPLNGPSHSSSLSLSQSLDYQPQQMQYSYDMMGYL